MRIPGPHSIWNKIKCWYNLYFCPILFPPPKVKSIRETLDALTEKQVSMVRFGDGEFKIMSDNSNGFQKKSPELGKRLREIVRTNSNDKILICVPDIPRGLELFRDDARAYWKWFLSVYAAKYYRTLNAKNTYFNAHVTRLYYDWKDRSHTEEWFAQIKTIWKERNVLIVEGEKTKLGIGNDLLSDAKSVRRIICPSISAFDFYPIILKKCKEAAESTENPLFLLALGQTATVLGYDLCYMNYQALDIGHIDVEYEWFLRKATKKEIIPGKFVNEVQVLSKVIDTDTLQYQPGEVLCYILPSEERGIENVIE